MISCCYKNKALYHGMIKDFLNQSITPLEFQRRQFFQRAIDIDNNRLNGYTDYYLARSLEGKQKIFKEKYDNPLYENSLSSIWRSALKAYEDGAKKLNIKGETFFMGIWDFIDENVREYNPRDAEYFNSREDVDETDLREKLQAAFDVLERNKDRLL